MFLRTPSLALPIVMLLVACAGTGKQKSVLEWQQMARTDLDAVRALVLAAHPGAIDAQNPSFIAAQDKAYQQALAMLPKVDNYDAMLAAVRVYSTSFQDGHMSYSDDTRKNEYTMRLAGWDLEQRDGRFVVSAVMPGWPAALPPVGAQLIGCDGQTPMEILAQRQAPYLDQRKQMLPRLAEGIGMAWFADEQLAQCSFLQNGVQIDHKMVYQEVSSKQHFDFRIANQAREETSRDNHYWLRDGTLWVSARNFQLQRGSKQVAELEKMLAELREAKGVKRIVFDSRFNTGGDSRIGDMIFEAATGGVAFDMPAAEQAKLAQTFAEWRVSAVSIASAQAHVKKMEALNGKGSSQVRDAQSFLQELLAARAAGKDWVRQEGGPRVTPADVARSGGKLKKYPGGMPVVLVTDSNCASACLNFADAVRMVPGMRHFGKVTSADAVYIDATLEKMPSGNSVMLPLKVWRNSVRANNEALVPEVVFDVDMADDKAVEAATLAAMGR